MNAVMPNASLALRRSLKFLRFCLIHRYPDENYGREIMQLYTIGLHHLNDDGTQVRDKFGRLIQTYNNHDILSNSRIWSGFEYTGKICVGV
jgi:uncharacterized protein (DUF1800 family)